MGKAARLKRGISGGIVRRMLRQEGDALKDVEEIRGLTPTDIMLVIKFEDGHIHAVYPDSGVVMEMHKKISEDHNLWSHGDFQLSETVSVKTLPDRIIFHNRQALGDIMMFTCAVRDFCKAFPDVKVRVQSTAMHLWDHNPYLEQEPFGDDAIDPFRGVSKPDCTDEKQIFAIEDAIREGRPVKVYIGPGKATNASNRSDMHFANAYRLSMESLLGVKIPQGEIRPDLYMSREEYDRPPIIEPPYWIIVAGEKGDWTAKTYPFDRWQQLVGMMPHIKFVQIGAAGHRHKKLVGDNVVDYIGKTENRNTGIRDLMNLFNYMEGSAGLVSFHMHLAAAFGKPCVVVAGAREPVWFTRYPGHRYLSTDGALPCTVGANGTPKSCWICDLNRCPEKCGDGREEHPLCVGILTVEQIRDAIQMYYDGGRLDKDNPSGRSKLIGIVGSKVMKIGKPKPKSKERKPAGWGFLWGESSITEADWKFISNTIKAHGMRSVLEFGSGLSTLLMATMGLKVTSYDCDGTWLKIMRRKIESGMDVDLILWDNKDELIERFSEFDLAFVDGPYGGESRELATKISSMRANHVIVHDAGRQTEKKWQDAHLREGFVLAVKGGTRCALWVRKTKLTPIKSTPKIGKSVTVMFNGRGDGGAEHSTTYIMNKFIDMGWDVNYTSPKVKPSGTFRRDGSKEVNFTQWGEPKDVDLLLIYVNDWVWDFKSADVSDFISAHMAKAKRRVMVVNYRLGEIGKLEWTRGWDKYIFLNSSLDELFCKRFESAIGKTRIMPPPTDLTRFLSKEPEYNNPMRIVRHSSQGDAKYPKNFNDIIRDILNAVPNVSISLMPAPSFLDDFGSSVIAYKRNEIPVEDFLAKGNVFWYMLPEGYQDQGPKVIMEAQAVGLPVVADNHSGPRDRVDHMYDGLLCNNRKSHVYSIRQLNRPSSREVMGARGKEKAKEQYNPDRWIEEILS